MSGKFVNSTTNFNTSFKQEQWIRQIVQSEIEGIFEEIKFEIETKIKSIDKNIFDMRNEIKKILQLQKTSNLADILERMEKIESEIRILKYNHQSYLTNSRTKSLEKERKSIFKRESEVDLSHIILGLEEDSSLKIDKKEAQLKSQLKYPPLPKEKLDASNQNSSKQSRQSSKAIKRNPILDSSDNQNIMRWLSDNNKETSCLGTIIKEEDIEQSIFI